MNLNQALQVIVRTHAAALERGIRASAIELKSGPGVGKSSVVHQACAALAHVLDEPVGLVVDILATKQSPDVLGFGLPDKTPGRPAEMIFTRSPWYPKTSNMQVYLPDGTLIDKGGWVLDGTTTLPRVGFLFLDEYGQAEDDVKKAAAELLLNGEVGDTRLPLGWRVIAASNRLSDRSGVLRALAFITNRRMELSIDAHLPTWNDWTNAQPPELRPHHLTVSFANRQPDLVFRDAVPAGDAPFCTPRTLVLMDRDLQALRTEEDIIHDRLPMDPIAREVCAGWIGGGESAQFFTHIKFADQLPDIEEIERAPDKAKLPAERAGQMVAAFMVAHHVTETNAAKLVTYINRMNTEMAVLCMRTITSQKDKAKLVANTLEFSNWLLKHKDLLIASHG